MSGLISKEANRFDVRARAHEIAASAQQLAAQAERLERLVGEFSV